MKFGALALMTLGIVLIGCGAAPGGAAKSPEPSGGAEPPGAFKSGPIDEAKTESSVPPSQEKEADGKKSVDSASVVSEPLSGSLSQADIRAVITKPQNAMLFNDCYTIGAGKNKEFIATVTVKATLGPNGDVSVVEVKKSTAKNQKVDTCVADAFKKIKFPAPKGGATSVITFPLEFKGVEEVQP